MRLNFHERLVEQMKVAPGSREQLFQQAFLLLESIDRPQDGGQKSCSINILRNRIG